MNIKMLMTRRSFQSNLLSIPLIYQSPPGKTECFEMTASDEKVKDFTMRCCEVAITV